MSVCVLFFFFHREMGSLVSSHSHMKQREVHTHMREIHTTFFPSLSFCSLFASAYCIIALTLDFCQSLSISEKWQIHMSWQTGGEGKGFLFSERGRTLRYFKSQRVWVTAGCQRAVPQVTIRCLQRVSYLSGCSCQCLSTVISQGALESLGSSDWVTQSWRLCDSTVKVPEGHVKKYFLKIESKTTK